MKKFIGIAIIVICLSLVFLLGIISYQAVTLTEQHNWLIDFEDKNNTISSYGSLSAAVVAMLSTILLVYTIFTQLQQFKKQKRQFNKQFRLQKNQFEAEKRHAEYEEKKDMFFQLKLVDTFLISFIRHLEIMAAEIKTCFEYEKQNPMLHVNINN